jgi:hypothetical protein
VIPIEKILERYGRRYNTYPGIYCCPICKGNSALLSYRTVLCPRCGIKIENRGLYFIGWRIESLKRKLKK